MSQFNPQFPPQYPQQPFQQPKKPPPPGYHQPTQSSGKATISLVLGLLSFCFSLLTGIPAVILGLLAMRDINRSQGQMGGKGLAITGLITGIIGTLMSLCPILFVAAMAGAAIPGFEQARMAATMTQSKNNLKQIGLGMHNYHDTYKSFPPVGDDAQQQQQQQGPGFRLSWRVRLLPFAEYVYLHDQFDYSKEWNESPNQELMSPMPEIYESPGRVTMDDTTVYLAVVSPAAGPNIPPDSMTMFQRGPRLTSFADILDGTSNTVMVVEADESEAAAWTAPKDWNFDANNPRRGLGQMRPGGFLVLFGDGSVQLISNDIDDETLRRLMQRADGQVVDSWEFSR